MFSSMALFSLFSLLIPITTAIVGGQPVEDPALSYTVAIVQPQFEDTFKFIKTTFICSGALITPTTVITASSCAWDIASEITVRVGLTPDTQTNISLNRIDMLRPEDSGILKTNIAVLKLNESVADGIGFATLPAAESHPRLPTRLASVGWGPTVTGTQAISDVLRTAPVALTDTDTCTQRLSTCGHVLERSSRFCASSTASGAPAYGDRGGLLVGGDGTLIGLMTHNTACAGHNGIQVMLNPANPEINAFIRARVKIMRKEGLTGRRPASLLRPKSIGSRSHFGWAVFAALNEYSPMIASA